MSPGDTTLTLTPPFPYFGAKRAIAPLIWEALGNPAVYVEPFLGSASVLLARPSPPRVETVNDASAFLTNFWRALQHDPDTVAHYADQPVNELNMHAMHIWLMTRQKQIERLREDMDWYDAKMAGLWVYGQCAWIGHGWCPGPDYGLHKTRTHLTSAGQGLHRKRPHLHHYGNGLHRKRPMVAADREGHGLYRQKPCIQGHSPTSGLNGTSTIQDWLQRLATRLRYVRVCCGDWSRVVTPVVLHGAGITAIYLDPPYRHAERDRRLYSVDEDVSAAVGQWARANGSNPRYRIALSGYEGHYDLPGWRQIAWAANGGLANQGHKRGRENKTREVLWLSPYCEETQLCLFPSPPLLGSPAS